MKKSAITLLTDAGEYMNIERELKVGKSILHGKCIKTLNCHAKMHFFRILAHW